MMKHPPSRNSWICPCITLVKCCVHFNWRQVLCMLLSILQLSPSYVTTLLPGWSSHIRGVVSHQGAVYTEMWDLVPDFGSFITGRIAWQGDHITGRPLYTSFLCCNPWNLWLKLYIALWRKNWILSGARSLLCADCILFAIEACLLWQVLVSKYKTKTPTNIYHWLYSLLYNT